MRVVSICGLLGLIAQLLLAFTGSSLMSWFPPLFPQSLILAVLAVAAFICGEARILRRVLVGVCAGAVLISGLMGFYALGYSNTRSQTHMINDHTSVKCSSRVWPGYSPSCQPGRMAKTAEPMAVVHSFNAS